MTESTAELPIPSPHVHFWRTAMFCRALYAFLVCGCGIVLCNGIASAQDFAFGGTGPFTKRPFTGFGTKIPLLPVINTPVSDVSGLGTDERIVTIDHHPSDGLVYGIALNSVLDTLKVYELNALTGGVVIKFGPFPVVNDPDTLGGGAINPTTDAYRVVLSNGYHGVFNFDGTKADLPTPFFKPGDPNAGKTPRLHNLAYLDSFFAFDSGTGSVVQGPTPTGELTTLKKITSASNDRVIGFDIARSSALFVFMEKNPLGINQIEHNPETTVTTKTFRFLAMPRFPEGLSSFSHLELDD
jgi:hypothetical protein